MKRLLTETRHSGDGALGAAASRDCWKQILDMDGEKRRQARASWMMKSAVRQRGHFSDSPEVLPGGAAANEPAGAQDMNY